MGNQKSSPSGISSMLEVVSDNVCNIGHPQWNPAVRFTEGFCGNSIGTIVKIRLFLKRNASKHIMQWMLQNKH